MNKIEIFKNSEFGEVRTMIIDNKEYFCGSDIAKALGYARPSDALKAHCRYTVKCDIPHPQSSNKLIDMLFIPEGDIYRLVVRSKLPTADKFEFWVFDEVLPDIRKHGLYATESVIDRIIDDPDFGIELLTKYKEEKQARKLAEGQRNKLIHQKKLYTSSEIAKELGFRSAAELNKKLGELKIQYKVNKTWVLSAAYSEKGYTSIKQGESDSGHIYYDRKWTGTGRDFILEELN